MAVPELGPNAQHLIAAARADLAFGLELLGQQIVQIRDCPVPGNVAVGDAHIGAHAKVSVGAEHRVYRSVVDLHSQMHIVQHRRGAAPDQLHPAQQRAQIDFVRRPASPVGGRVVQRHPDFQRHCREPPPVPAVVAVVVRVHETRQDQFARRVLGPRHPVRRKVEIAAKGRDPAVPDDDVRMLGAAVGGCHHQPAGEYDGLSHRQARTLPPASTIAARGSRRWSAGLCPRRPLWRSHSPIAHSG